MKSTEKFEEITLNGIKIHIYENKIQIFNDDNVPFYDFKSTSDRLVQYMMDEMFIERKKFKIEVVTP
jgi:hypothetical protein